MRVCAPDGGVREFENAGRRYASKDGVYDLPDRDAKALLKVGGFNPGVGLAGSGKGYTCLSCGFGSWFTTCSRCSGTCSKQ